MQFREDIRIFRLSQACSLGYMITDRSGPHKPPVGEIALNLPGVIFCPFRAHSV
jgi:hypothetical protein